MAVIETWLEQDLQAPVKVRYLDGNLFSNNGNGNRIGVRVYNNGEPVTLSGTVSGYVVVADGSTVPCTGSRSGNQASILIPPAAYQPGAVFISVFLTDGSTVTTLAAVSTTVMQTRTNSQVSPGSVVTDWTQTINAAMQSVVDANAANMAQTYGELTFPVPMGKYTLYNDLLYRAVTPIATSESWTAAHWTRVKLADDVSDLKTAITKYTGNAEYNDWIGPKKYIALNGSTTDVSSPSTSSGSCQCMVVSASEGDQFTIKAKGGSSSRAYGFVSSGGDVLEADEASKTRVDYVVTAPANTAYLVVNDTLYTGYVYGGKFLESRVTDNENATNSNIQKTDKIANSLIEESSVGVLWKEGGWSTVNGTKSSNDKRLRCQKGVFNGLDYIVKAESGVVFVPLYYDGSTYKTRDNYDFVSEADIKALAPSGATGFMLSARTDPESVVTNYVNTIGAKIHFYHRCEAPKNENVLTITDTISTMSRNDIVFTRVSANKFTLSGTASSTSTPKAFVGFNGNANTSGGASASDFEKNITKPGKYKIMFTTSDDIDFNPFYITASNYANRVALKNGDTFVVENGTPVCFFVSSPSQKSYSSALTIEVFLYYETDQREKASAVDYYAREAISDIQSEISGIVVEPAKWGISNILANARQLYDLKFTPLEKMPKTTLSDQSENSYFPANTEVTGVPYSSARAYDKMVGVNVSLKTFMSAVQNPKSVLYTRRLTTPNANTYYGAVCSVLIADCYNMKTNLTTQDLYYWDELDEKGYIGVEVGDCLVSKDYGHGVVVIGLTKDKYGRISNVLIAEEIHPVAHTKSYTYDSFKSHYTGQHYKVFRYKHYEDVDYTAVPYVKGYADEEDTTITYPDIMSEFGDAAVFSVGEDVKMNVIDSTGYDTITVKKDGETVSTSSTISDFTIENVSGGLYTVEMTGTGKETSTTFFVVNYACSYNSNTHIVTFSSTNATPQVVHVYNSTPTNKAIILTDADRTAGQIDVSNYIDDENYIYVKVTFLTEYGTATWYSHDLEQWVPFGN